MNLNHNLIAVLTLSSLNILGCGKSGTTVNEELSRAEYEIRRQRIIEFFAERQKRYEIVATTKTESGEIIDWIRPESQIPDGKVATTPPDLQSPESKVDSAYLQGDSDAPDQPDVSVNTELQVDKKVVGPPGTIPIVRFNVEAYLKANPKYLPKDPRDILNKIPPPEPPNPLPHN